jgi:hypothetical protein
MTPEPHQPPTPGLLDEWIGEIGEAGVVAAIEDARRRIADGSLPGFTDADALVRHWSAHRAAQA